MVHGHRLQVQLGGGEGNLGGGEHTPRVLRELAASHPFNHCVQVLLPCVPGAGSSSGDGAAAAPAAAAAGPLLAAAHAELQAHTAFYHVVEGSLAALLAPDFAARYFRLDDAEGAASSTRLRAVSLPVSPSDAAAAAAVALTPDGTLHLRVSPPTHARLGLPGRRLPLAFRRVPRGRKQQGGGDDDRSNDRGGGDYLIALRVAPRGDDDGQSGRERAVQRLTRCAPPMRLLCTFTDAADGAALPGFEPPPGMKPLGARPVLQEWRATLATRGVPLFSGAWLRGGDGGKGVGVAGWEARARAAYDWLGAVAVGAADVAPPPGVPATTATHNNDARVDTHSWRGQLAPEFVLALAAVARRAVDAGAAPWAALLVSGGFGGAAAAPVAWWGFDRLRVDERHGADGGAAAAAAAASCGSHYLVLLLPERGQVATFAALGPADVPAPPGCVQWAAAPRVAAPTAAAGANAMCVDDGS